jgi:hypothetical protein
MTPTEQLFLVVCPTCRGEGGWDEPDGLFSRWHLDPPSGHFVTCEMCGGRGEFLEAEPPVGPDLIDLEERCGDFA